MAYLRRSIFIFSLMSALSTACHVAYTHGWPLLLPMTLRYDTKLSILHFWLYFHNKLEIGLILVCFLRTKIPIATSCDGVHLHCIANTRLQWDWVVGKVVSENELALARWQLHDWNFEMFLIEIVNNLNALKLSRSCGAFISVKYAAFAFLPRGIECHWKSILINPEKAPLPP